MMINIGFGNIVSSDKLVVIVTPEAAPIRRLVQEAKASGRLVDATCGRRTRAVLVMDNDQIILSALQPETIAGRYAANKKDNGQEDAQAGGK